MGQYGFPNPEWAEVSEEGNDEHVCGGVLLKACLGLCFLLV